MKTYERVLDALGDPTRRQVFERLRKGPRSVGELARGLPVSRPAVSQHLRALTAAGLVMSHPEGARRVYAINPAALAELRAYVERLRDEALAGFDS